jgi:hypothetical protein
MSPAEVVQGQLESYNARDLHEFLQFFSDSVQVFRPPLTEPSLSGKARLADFYASQRFNRSDLHATLLHRIVLGNKVIDHERIFGVQENPFELAVVYEVQDGLIQTLWTYAAM